MPSRRAHTNSHHGCLRCKSKRVKVKPARCIASWLGEAHNGQCDQTQPQCIRCQRHNADCVYRHLLTTYDPFVHQSGHPENPSNRQLLPRQRAGQPSPPTPSLLSPSLATTPLSDLPDEERYLFHHYVGTLAKTDASAVLSSGVSQLMEDSIVRNSCNEQFVQYSVLSYAALHLSSVSKGEISSKHLVTALRHKDAAIARFRPILSTSISPEHCEAGIAASTILIACLFGLPMADHTNSTDLNHIDLLAQLCGLFQGITALLKLGGCQTAVLSAMRTAKMPHHSRAVAIREVSWAEADKSIDQLVGAINALDEADDGSRKRKHVLGKGASKLHALVQGVARGENNWEAVCMWLGRVDAEFVDMIRNRDPLALVLLTHWIVTRNGLNVWWASQWTRLAITAITPVLDGQYVHLLDWCMQEAGAAPSTRVEDIKEDEVL